MITGSPRRLLSVLSLVTVFAFLAFLVSVQYDYDDYLPSFGRKDSPWDSLASEDQPTKPIKSPLPKEPVKQEEQSKPAPVKGGAVSTSPDKVPSLSTVDEEPEVSYREVSSVSRPDGNYFPIKFDGYKIFNPSIIPHPSKDETYIVVTQRERNTWDAKQMVCNAVFKNDVLTCLAPPTNLSIPDTKGGHCKGKQEWQNYVTGPHDARVFYGPQTPYILYGSASGYACLGEWLQDLTTLVDDFATEESKSPLWQNGTEMLRPGSFGQLEKNWFVFWDKNSEIFVHHDLAPSRVFAKLESNGSVGEDLAPLATSDKTCMKELMPQVPKNTKASVHQATNALSITMCKRSDPSCKSTDDNTFIMIVFQVKYYYPFRSVYRPYALLFKQRAPFEVHAISQRPFWFKGHKPVEGKEFDVETIQAEKEKRDEKKEELPEIDAEQYFVTSMTWKTPGQRYHGYLDDPLFLGFGIEDHRAGAIDVLAGDLLQDLGMCADVV